MKAEKQKNKSVPGKNGGVRPGAGRPKGSQNKATKEKVKMEKLFNKKVMGSINRLFNAQMALAEGVMYLYRIDKDPKGKNDKPVIVTDPEEIQEFLADEIDSDSYYYISTERPDNRAIDSLLDRIFGKPKQKHEHSGEGGEPIQISFHKSLKVDDE